MFLLLLVLLNIWTIIDCRETHELQSPRITYYGDWHALERCPDGMYAHGMQIKYQQYQKKGDDTCLNAIRLYCQPIGYYGFKQDRWIMSGEGMWGDWQAVKFCPRGTAIIGYALRSEPPQGGRKDDGAADNFKVYCGKPNGKRTVDSYVQGDTKGFGDWTANQFCWEGYVACGIQTQIERSQGKKDDTSLNNVDMECCKVPLSVENCKPKYSLVQIAELDNRQGAGTVTKEYHTQVSHTKTTSTTVMNSIEEKLAIARTISSSVTIGLNIGQLSSSATFTDERTTTRETISINQLQDMIQDAVTHERSETDTFTVPAYHRVIIEQLYVTCGDDRVGLAKTISRSN